MKKSVVLSAIAGGMAVAGAASADFIYDLGMIGPINSAPNGGVTVNVFHIDVPAGLNIIGFAFEGFYDEDPTPSASWASDTLLVIETPGGLTLSVGGITTPSDIDWDFQGGGSTDPGFYDHMTMGWSLGPVNPQGVWTLTFTNDWNSTSASAISWDDAIFTLIEVPAPGAAALLGLAGLLGVRRRRTN